MTGRKIYAFDVDHTLWLSDGPVQWGDIAQLHLQGHIIGLCGNWAYALPRMPHNDYHWTSFINFLGPMEMTKAAFLKQLKRYIPCTEYVFVGNDNRDPKWNGRVISQDAVAAEEARWRFICEDDFARGVR